MPFPPNATPVADCEAVTAAEALEVLQALARSLAEMTSGNEPSSG